MDQLPIELFTLITMQLATEVSFRTFMVSLKALSTTSKMLRQHVRSEYLLGFVVDHYCIQGYGEHNRSKVNDLFLHTHLCLYKYRPCQCAHHNPRCPCTYTNSNFVFLQQNYSERELYEKLSIMTGSELVWINLDNRQWKTIQTIDIINASHKLAKLRSCIVIRYLCKN